MFSLRPGVIKQHKPTQSCGCSRRNWWALAAFVLIQLNTTQPKFHKRHHTKEANPSVYKDKDKDVFIVPKEMVLHMMMTQTKDKLFHQLK